MRRFVDELRRNGASGGHARVCGADGPPGAARLVVRTVLSEPSSRAVHSRVAAATSVDEPDQLKPQAAPASPRGQTGSAIAPAAAAALSGVLLYVVSRRAPSPGWPCRPSRSSAGFCAVAPGGRASGSAICSASASCCRCSCGPVSRSVRPVAGPRRRGSGVHRRWSARASPSSSSTAAVAAVGGGGISGSRARRHARVRRSAASPGARSPSARRTASSFPGRGEQHPGARLRGRALRLRAVRGRAPGRRGPAHRRRRRGAAAAALLGVAVPVVGALAARSLVSNSRPTARRPSPSSRAMCRARGSTSTPSGAPCSTTTHGRPSGWPPEVKAGKVRPPGPTSCCGRRTPPTSTPSPTPTPAS